MSLTDAYLITAKNLESVFNAIKKAQAPERFNQQFLEQLGFTSSNDRSYIKLLKELGFLAESGDPTERYIRFLDDSMSGVVLANAIKDAYGDLFQVNKSAWSMQRKDVKGKLKTLTQGKKSDKVLDLMAMTFEALCKHADFTSIDNTLVKGDKSDKENIGNQGSTPAIPDKQSIKLPQLHYTIQLHLPESKDIRVYDVLFESMRKHLF